MANAPSDRKWPQEGERAILEAEVARRLALTIKEWVPLGELEFLTGAIRGRLAALRHGRDKE